MYRLIWISLHFYPVIRCQAEIGSIKWPWSRGYTRQWRGRKEPCLDFFGNSGTLKLRCFPRRMKKRKPFHEQSLLNCTAVCDLRCDSVDTCLLGCKLLGNTSSARRRPPFGILHPRSDDFNKQPTHSCSKLSGQVSETHWKVYGLRMNESWVNWHEISEINKGHFFLCPGEGESENGSSICQGFSIQYYLVDTYLRCGHSSEDSFLSTLFSPQL